MRLIIRNILILPLVITRDIFKAEKPFRAKVFYFFLTLLIIFPAWIKGYLALGNTVKLFAYNLGLVDKLTNVTVSGESMMPTILDSSQIKLHNPQKYGLVRGDIVSFKNIETGNLHYIKRIIGLPGETISIKNGHVSINGNLLHEDYILNNLPTYGNTFLAECESYPVPKNYYLVLGDNRTVSHDSRAIGFIKKEDIDGVIKTEVVETFLNEQTQKAILKAMIEPNVLVEKINEERKKKSVESLIVNNLLNEIAFERATSIKDSFNNWKEEGKPAEKILENKGYQYTLAHEFVTFGYLDEKSITDQILESPLDQTSFLSNNYAEIGIGVVEKTNGECSFPIVSVLVAWPNSPTYSREVKDFWAQQLNETKNLLSLLQNLVGRPGFNQSEVQDLTRTMAESVDIATQVNQKINNKEWLDSQQVDRYTQLIKENQPRLEALLKNIESQMQNSDQSQQQSSPQRGSSPTTQSSSKFISAGQKTVEKGVTATINSAQEEGGKFKIKVTFANISNENAKIWPLRLSIRSQTLGGPPTPAIGNYPLSPGQVKPFDFSYEKLSNPPYRWVYLSSSGESIELGSYNP